MIEHERQRRKEMWDRLIASGVPYGVCVAPSREMRYSNRKNSETDMASVAV